MSIKTGSIGVLFDSCLRTRDQFPAVYDCLRNVPQSPPSAGFVVSVCLVLSLAINRFSVYVSVYVGSIRRRIPMACTVTPLSDSKSEAAKPRDKDYTLWQPMLQQLKNYLDTVIA